jgi:anti-sigma factor ChrR (cupin superfamily)
MTIEDKTIALVIFHSGSSSVEHVHNNFETIYVIDGEYYDEYGIHKQGDLLKSFF